MIFKPRKKRHELPGIPDDSAERAQAKVESAARLQDALALQRRASGAAAELTRQNRINHYTRRLMDAYVVGGMKHG